MGGRKSGLGRGLESLIPVERPDTGYSEIPLERITPNPTQPRGKVSEESLEGLAASIREVGVLQPVVVRAGDDDGYVLIAGERRWRASKAAGLEVIPAIIRESGDSLVEALIENVQREDLTALEEAAAFQDLVEGSGLTHEEVGRKVGKSRTAVSNALRLLSLPAAIQGMLDRAEISAGAARALLGLEDEAYAVHVAKRASDEGWSVRQVEEAVRARQDAGAVSKGRTSTRGERPAAILELEERLGEHLQTPVRIDYGRRGGKVIVKFKSLDDLERIYKQFYG